ncbi:hypothetical protein FHS31_002828 [Sphingomonas vulcanisoli]|uniref:Uncharacterized protein n=1 Tax=Sphingomonas vulcanisoli TaxID=1658060 RepID=A0ABX0TUJ2_9SPHN|nr:hypothetical protein [Sphingomonas vulcanisoli]NIJ09196.1 hypothetical protein [Sphingomonas vulcanisoli]
MKPTLFFLPLSIAVVVLPVSAQRISTNNADNAPPITVRGIPDAPPNPKATLNPRVPGSFQIESSNAYSRADIFVRCVGPDAKALWPIVEGPPNETTTATMQGLFVMHNRACRIAGSELGLANPTDLGRYSNAGTPNSDSQVSGSPTAFYDRGALIEYAIKKYAADVRVTKADTHSEPVVNRFIAVEQGRNRFRWPEDLAYFKIAACMVQAQPELSSDLIASKPGSVNASRIGFTIIARAHLCVPRARHIEVDPTQFRVYIADAYYRWAEATKGVDALVPARDEAS